MENLIGIKEACEILNLSRSSMKRYVSSGAIPSYKIGKHRFFVAEELRTWVERQKEKEPPVVFKFRWITQMSKWIDKIEKLFQAPGEIGNLSFQQKLCLYEQISRNINRNTKFLFKLRATALEAGENFCVEQPKQKGNLANGGYAC